MQDSPIMRAGQKGKPAGHSQMHQQVFVASQSENKPLAMAINFLKFTSLNLLTECGWRQRINRARPFNAHLLDNPPFHTGIAKLTADSFDLWKLRHLSPMG